VTAKDITEAKRIKSQMDFDIIPIKVNGKITTYYNSNSRSEEKIAPQEIISESAGILETLGHLSRRDFYFVLSGNNITQIIHYSDLNNPLVLIALYAQISYCEIAIRNFVRSHNRDNSQSGIEKFLNQINQNIQSQKKINVNTAIKRFKKKLVDLTQTDVFNELQFDDELILLRELFSLNLPFNQFKIISSNIGLSDGSIRSYNKLRTEIMHSKPEIIKQKSDISKWVNFLNFCQDIIKAVSGKVIGLTP